MTSVKVKFRASTNKDKEGVIFYQVIHDRVVRQVRTDYKLFAREWDDRISDVIMLPDSDSRASYISTLKDLIKLDLDRLSRVVETLRSQGLYSADDVVSTYINQFKAITLYEFMQSCIIRLVELRKYRTSETYKTALNSFMRFREGEDIRLADISCDVMMDYEVYLKSQGIMMNTISFYMRILRAIYNQAIDRELIGQRHPFKKVYTGVGKTTKRALTLKNIKKIKELDLSSVPELIFARDMFMFSFFTRGMSFVDMSYLRKKDLKNGILTYRRRKTGQQLHIKWERCMQEIVDHYPPHDTEYLLPIICDRDKDDRLQYRNMSRCVNVKLKEVGTLGGLVLPLTHYVARHSWASIAKSRNIPISVISEGMGHDSESTTQIYLASLDSSIVDKANNTILRLL